MAKNVRVTVQIDDEEPIELVFAHNPKVDFSIGYDVDKIRDGWGLIDMNYNGRANLSLTVTEFVPEN